MVDLQLKWTVGIGSGGLGHNLHSPTRTPLLIFDHQPPLWYKFISLSSLLLPLKSMIAAIGLHWNTYSCYTTRPRNFGVWYMQGLNVLIWPSWRSCRVTFVSQDLWWHFTVTWTHEKSLYIISSSVWALKGQKSCHACNCIKHLVGPCIMRPIITIVVFSNCVFWLWRLSISTTAMPGRFSMT